MKNHGSACKGTYGVLCLNCNERVDTGEEGAAKAIDLAWKVDRLMQVVQALDRLFGDPGVHPVVFRSLMPDGRTISRPKVNDKLHQCDHCVDNLFELAEAFYAYRKEIK